MNLLRSLFLSLRAPRWVPALALLTLVACGGGDNPRSDAGYATMGMPGIPSPSRVGANLVFADVSINDVPGGRLGIDTGSPIMLVDAAKFPGLTLPTTTQVTANVTAGSFTIDDVPLLQVQIGSPMDPLNFAGLFGGNVMQQFPVRLDYAHPTNAFRLGMPAMEMNVDGVEIPGAAVAFKLEGGGRGQLNNTLITFPATRIPVDVDLEGTLHHFILDTGASETTIRATLFDTLTADGRFILTGLPISTVAGPKMGRVTRVRALTVAGATVTTPVVMTIGDDIIDTIQGEVGHPVDGLLGGNFLREFMVTIDYPGRTLHLQRYTSAEIVDEFQRVGFELGGGGGAHRYAIGALYQGTDAQRKMLAEGDEIVSVDGTALDALDSVTADDMLNGMVGATHAIGLGTAQSAGLSNTTIDVLIEDLVPPPQ